MVGVGFTRVLYWIEDACDWAWRWPEWARPAVGGLLLGALLLALPEMYGVGYPVLGRGVAGHYALGFLLVLLVGKMVATSLTIGIGGSGGVFAPSLFIGAMLGASFGIVMHDLVPGMSGPVGAYGLIGMGAVFAGSARAPITAVVILFELTNEYSIILPLMAAIVLATGVSQLLTRDTIYTLKLRRRGIDLDAPSAGGGALATTTAGEVMRPIGSVLSSSVSLVEAAKALTLAPRSSLPVVDAAGHFLGVATARGIADVLADGKHDETQVSEVIENVRAISTATVLSEALEVLDRGDADALPVLDAERSVVGWLTYQCVLTAVRGRPAAAGAPARRPGHRRPAAETPAHRPVGRRRSRASQQVRCQWRRSAASRSP